MMYIYMFNVCTHIFAFFILQSLQNIIGLINVRLYIYDFVYKF